MAGERLNKAYKTLSIVFAIVLTGLTAWWILSGETGFLADFSLIWWVVLFFMEIEHIMEWALGGKLVKSDRYINITLLLIFIFLLSTPYLKKFFLWRVYVPTGSMNVCLILLLFLLVVVVYGTLWISVAHLRITYLKRSGREITFSERLKIVAVVLSEFVFVLVMLKMMQFASW